MAYDTTKTCEIDLVIETQAAAAPVGHGCEVVEAEGGADLGPPGPLGLLLQVGSRALPCRHLRLAVLPVLLSSLQPAASSNSKFRVLVWIKVALLHGRMDMSAHEVQTCPSLGLPLLHVCVGC